MSNDDIYEGQGVDRPAEGYEQAVASWKRSQAEKRAERERRELLAGQGIDPDSAPREGQAERAPGEPRFIGDAGIGQYLTVRMVFDALAYAITGIALIVIGAQPDVSAWLIPIGIASILYAARIVLIGGTYWVWFIVYVIAFFAVLAMFGVLAGGGSDDQGSAESGFSSANPIEDDVPPLTTDENADSGEAPGFQDGVEDEYTGGGVPREGFDSTPGRPVEAWEMEEAWARFDSENPGDCVTTAWCSPEGKARIESCMLELEAGTLDRTLWGEAIWDYRDPYQWCLYAGFEDGQEWLDGLPRRGN